nr:C2 calcium-dependent domain-containing protein 4A-like [Vulpes vulpes]
MWCLDRLRLGPERLRSGRNGVPQGRAHRLPTLAPAAWENVLTPDRIPEFCIPPRLAPCTGVAALRVSWSQAAALGAAAGHTDWDPRSQAALSLPHLPRGRTAYGFCALLESPHTRRKESLFLGGPGAAPPPPPPPGRVSFVLRPPGQTRPQRSAVVRPSRAAASEQDVWLDGLSEEQLRRLAVRVQAEERGRGRERGRLRGQGELLLGALLLPAGPGLRPPPRAK